LGRDSGALAARSDGRIEYFAFPVVRPKHELASYEIRGKGIESVVRSAVVHVNENRTDFGVGIAIRQRLVGQQQKILGSFRYPQTDAAGPGVSLNLEIVPERILARPARILGDLRGDRNIS
ncbi:MAG: hypothetical protein JWN27_3636, partial [Candidatus Eremiobacteraeota bacterium]|nr:hypothetical protein [Candidatus Eremiobacteraeota bacterium]